MSQRLLSGTGTYALSRSWCWSSLSISSYICNNSRSSVCLSDKSMVSGLKLALSAQCIILLNSLHFMWENDRMQQFATLPGCPMKLVDNRHHTLKAYDFDFMFSLAPWSSTTLQNDENFVLLIFSKTHWQESEWNALWSTRKQLRSPKIICIHLTRNQLLVYAIKVTSVCLYTLIHDFKPVLWNAGGFLHTVSYDCGVHIGMPAKSA